MYQQKVRQLVEEATFDYTMGDHRVAIGKLQQALGLVPDDFDALLAISEIHYDLREFDQARNFAEKALSVRPEDVHLHTSLSRIWMELGDKERAEQHGAQARMLGWKRELQNKDTEED